MRNILDKLIDKLDRRLSEERRDNPNNDSIVGMFTFGNHIVRFVFNEKGCEIEIWNPANDVFLDNVAFYCEERVAKWDSIDTVTMSEHDYNGFRNEADFVRYKFG